MHIHMYMCIYNIIFPESRSKQYRKIKWTREDREFNQRKKIILKLHYIDA